MSMAGWPPSERPRERMLAQGAAALSDDEQWTLIGTLAHRRAQPPPLDPKRN